MKGNYENLSSEELVKKRDELKEEVRKIRFELAVSGTTPNPRRIREAKKSVARVLTLLNQRRKAEGTKA